MTKKKEDAKRLVWKLKELPSAEGVSKLVEQGVLEKEEAREILFKETTEDTDEVKALKEMVQTMKEMVDDLLKRPNVQLVPYTKVVEVPRRYKPYWEENWICTTSGSGGLSINSTSGSSGNTTYTMSVS